MQPGQVGNLMATARPIHDADYSKSPDGRESVGQHVIHQRSLPGDPRYHHADEHDSRVGDGRIGQQPPHIGLSQRDQIAQQQ